MRKFQFTCLLALLAAVVSWSSPTQAQISNQLYATPAGTGIACSASAPCSLSTAISVLFTRPGGEVSCIDGGFYQTNVLYSNGFTVDCPGAVLTSHFGPVFALNGPSSQVVILRNLTFDGGAADAAPFILVTGGATVIIENCKFQNIANSNAIAIRFLPTSPAAQLIIRDSAFINNGIAPGTGGGIQVAPAGGSASMLLERVSFNFNVTSMVLSGAVNATMINSTVSASRSTGVIVGSGSTLDIKDSTLAYNVGSAISVASGGTVRLSNNDIKSNQIGVSNSGGQALSYMNNRINANGTDGTPLASIQGGQ